MSFVSVLLEERGLTVQPWQDSPYRLISWWEMEKFSAHEFFYLGGFLRNASRNFEEQPRETVIEAGTFEEGSETHTIFANIKKRCETIGLRISVKCIDGMIQSHIEASTSGEVVDELKQLENTITLEMEDRLFMFIPSDRADYYNKAELFGKDVNTKMPNIQFDIVEAGNCYAAGRGTAAVFHLMRIMETGVQLFGTKLGVALANDKNWQNILDEANKAIKALPAKDPKTVELSQISSNLYAVKLAWRNEVMHPKETYTLEEAENLILQVKDIHQSPSQHFVRSL